MRFVLVIGILAGLSTSLLTVLGLSISLPQIPGLGESSRNLFFHVPMWIAMYLMMGISAVYSGLYLVQSQRLTYDKMAYEAAVTAFFFACLGLVTGILWSRVTWGVLLPDTDFTAWWSWDPKQTFALLALGVYGAYFVLRRQVPHPYTRARLGAMYNILALSACIPLTFFLPRLLGGLHPGSEGSPVFRKEDVSTLHRTLMYLGMVSFSLIALWIWQLRVRISKLSEAA
ncbi:MAG: cytochrome c biogenesis protein [Bacteroidia bacterium]